jgi:hypothetical protein
MICTLQKVGEALMREKRYHRVYHGAEKGRVGAISFVVVIHL